MKKSQSPYNIILKQPFVDAVSPSYNQMLELGKRSNNDIMLKFKIHLNLR